MNQALQKSLWIGVMLLFGASLTFCAAAAEESNHRHWTLADFGGVLSVGLEGHRNYPNGLAHYRTLCAHCHTLGRHGSGGAPDLTRRCLTYTPEELLGHILSTSKHLTNAAPKRGLLDSLTQAGVLDLLSFVLSGADPQSPFFFNP